MTRTADSPVVRGRSSGAASKPGVTAGAAPTLRMEKTLLRMGHSRIAGMDEVGRGALAGPVTVGVVVVEAGTRGAPAGVRDSKLLTPAARQALVPQLQRWAPAYAVGHAEPHEIDAYGIIAALRLAGRRALAQLSAPPTLVLLDGSHNWLTPPTVVTVDDRQGLLDLDLESVTSQASIGPCPGWTSNPPWSPGSRLTFAAQPSPPPASSRRWRGTRSWWNARPVIPGTTGQTTRGTALPTTCRHSGCGVRASSTGSRGACPAVGRATAGGTTRRSGSTSTAGPSSTPRPRVAGEAPAGGPGP